ncbi:hypothetical protein B0H34DRAFT_801211 [Crassisporium funariophilum]|nr:hypothetical protein B0H34DRAFT_801211 [Crassisporium funariophilum]
MRQSWPCSGARMDAIPPFPPDILAFPTPLLTPRPSQPICHRPTHLQTRTHKSTSSAVASLPQYLSWYPTWSDICYCAASHCTKKPQPQRKHLFCQPELRPNPIMQAAQPPYPLEAIPLYVMYRWVLASGTPLLNNPSPSLDFPRPRAHDPNPNRISNERIWDGAQEAIGRRGDGMGLVTLPRTMQLSSSVVFPALVVLSIAVVGVVVTRRWGLRLRVESESRQGRRMMSKGARASLNPSLYVHRIIVPSAAFDDIM